ncbi:MAG: acyl-CoA thioesterase-2, partial [Myxococcota bacterium]
RDGRSFATRRVVAIQHGKAIFAMSVSFQKPEEGIEHQVPMPDVKRPAELPDPSVARAAALARVPDEYRHWYEGDRPFEQFVIDPVDEFEPEKKEPYMGVWLRAAGPVPDDIALHQNLLAYASDMNLLDTCILPHGLSWMDPKFQSASLDHSIWFHRDFRIDEWLLFVQDGPSTSGARGINRGLVYTESGVLVASVVQEGLVRVHA